MYARNVKSARSAVIILSQTSLTIGTVVDNIRPKMLTVHLREQQALNNGGVAF